MRCHSRLKTDFNNSDLNSDFLMACLGFLHYAYRLSMPVAQANTLVLFFGICTNGWFREDTHAFKGDNSAWDNGYLASHMLSILALRHLLLLSVYSSSNTCHCLSQIMRSLLLYYPVPSVKCQVFPCLECSLTFPPTIEYQDWDFVGPPQHPHHHFASKWAFFNFIQIQN